VAIPSHAERGHRATSEDHQTDARRHESRARDSLEGLETMGGGLFYVKAGRALARQKSVQRGKVSRRGGQVFPWSQLSRGSWTKSHSGLRREKKKTSATAAGRRVKTGSGQSVMGPVSPDADC